LEYKDIIKESYYHDKSGMLLRGDCFDWMAKFPDKSVDMILCDLPYGISRDSGYVNNAPDKTGYIAKYGKHKIDFGEWDNKSIDLFLLADEYYRLLRDGGVAVIFYDIWGSETVSKSFADFKQPRILEWVKTNPVPINSKLNFLSNAKEYMFSFVKKSKPTFNSQYNNGIFNYPLCHGKERKDHPTQKPLVLFEELIKIYSQESNIILDNCAGTSTTAVACKKLNRRWICVEGEEEYCKISVDRINEISYKEKI